MFNSHQLTITVKLTVFSVHLNGFYTHLNAISIVQVPLNVVFKEHKQFYCLFRKLITRHVTFQLTPTLYYFEAYRLLKPSQWLVHPSQRNYYRKLSLEHGDYKSYTLISPFLEVNNSSRDFQLTPTLHYFKAYRLFSSSQWLLHPSQRNYYRKSYLEHIAFSGSE